MATKSALDLLDKTRIYVLEQAALGYTAIGLSAATFSIDRPLTLGNPQADHRVHFANRWYTNSRLKKDSKLGHRGHVQRCLSELAKSGIMYQRTRPEPHVARYEHGETDKHFRIRITKDEAIAKLREMGRKVPVRETGWSANWKPSLGATPNIKWVA